MVHTQVHAAVWIDGSRSWKSPWGSSDRSGPIDRQDQDHKDIEQIGPRGEDKHPIRAEKTKCSKERKAEDIVLGAGPNTNQGCG